MLFEYLAKPVILQASINVFIWKCGKRIMSMRQGLLINMKANPATSSVVVTQHMAIRRRNSWWYIFSAQLINFNNNNNKIHFDIRSHLDLRNWAVCLYDNQAVGRG